MRYLVKKYKQPAPRYTSYPTVPHWSDTPGQEEWEQHVRHAFMASNKERGISLYIHLPFCESLCTFCGCNKRITVNHDVEKPYIDSVLQEWHHYLELFPSRPRLQELHLGGGTPTFFSARHLQQLIEGILNTVTPVARPLFGLEAHPHITTVKQLKVLRDLGFRRLSLGVQDFDEKVQAMINREQTVEEVTCLTNEARDLGYNSINFDLVYGLPHQTPETIDYTLQQTEKLLPDRIAYYSYAHVPWKIPAQQRYDESELPTSEQKLAMHEQGKRHLERMGYIEIGMDHYALPHDDLYKAAQDGKLHRNFMGYTEANTRLLIGLGASSISDTWTCFVQNKKKVEEYQDTLHQKKFPFFRGHQLNEEDKQVRPHIHNLMCDFETSWSSEYEEQLFTAARQQLEEFENDGLIHWEQNKLTITERGKQFVRIICKALDKRLQGAEAPTKTKKFSNSF